MASFAIGALLQLAGMGGLMAGRSLYVGRQRRQALLDSLEAATGQAQPTGQQGPPLPPHMARGGPLSPQDAQMIATLSGMDLDSAVAMYRDLVGQNAVAEQNRLQRQVTTAGQQIQRDNMTAAAERHTDDVRLREEQLDISRSRAESAIEANALQRQANQLKLRQQLEGLTEQELKSARELAGAQSGDLMSRDESFRVSPTDVQEANEALRASYRAVNVLSELRAMVSTIPGETIREDSVKGARIASLYEDLGGIARVLDDLGVPSGADLMLVRRQYADPTDLFAGLTREDGAVQASLGTAMNKMLGYLDTDLSRYQQWPLDDSIVALASAASRDAKIQSQSLSDQLAEQQQINADTKAAMAPADALLVELLRQGFTTVTGTGERLLNIFK